MQIVAVQLDILWENKDWNHRRVEQLLAEYSIQPGSLILLPEMFDTGFSMNLEIAAQSPQRESEAFLRELAARYQSTVLAGVIGPMINGQAANLAVAFDAGGDELVQYQKQRPFTLVGEDKKYPPGFAAKIFQWEGVRVAPFVCYDLRFPELFRPAAFQGAELIVVIACWPAVRSEHWVRLLQARAIENLAVCVGVNRCGEEPGLKFDGRTCAFDHFGVEMFQADGHPQVLQTQMDVESLRRWRQKFPALQDAQRFGHGLHPT